MKKTLFAFVCLVLTMIVGISSTVMSFAGTKEQQEVALYKNTPKDYKEFVTRLGSYPLKLQGTDDNNLDKDILYREYAYLSDPRAEYVYDYTYDSWFDDYAGTFYNVWKNTKHEADKAKVAKGLAVLNKMTASGSAYWKAWTLFKKVGERIDYTAPKGSEDTQGVYAAYTGRGSCHAYAMCYLYVCKRNGIPCETVWDNDHIWNIVKLNGKWKLTEIRSITPIRMTGV